MAYLSNQHAGATNIDIGLLPYLKYFHGVSSMLDIGCGPGGNVEYARSLGIDAYGVDGDSVELSLKPYFQAVDYQSGSSTYRNTFDIGWSVEFAEHVEEEYSENYFLDYKKCKSVIFTAAPPGWGGIGHVNERENSYWIEKFEGHGFKFSDEMTTVAREVSCLIFRNRLRPQRKQFVKNRGLVFQNMEYGAMLAMD